MFGIEDVEKTCLSNKRLLLTNFVRPRDRPTVLYANDVPQEIKAAPSRWRPGKSTNAPERQAKEDAACRLSAALKQSLKKIKVIGTRKGGRGRGCEVTTGQTETRQVPPVEDRVPEGAGRGLTSLTVVGDHRGLAWPGLG